MSHTPRVALVHDELIRRGGAEIVFEELLRIFPQADVYALYAGNNPFIRVDGTRKRIHTSSLQKMPLWFRRHPGRLLPFLSQAAEQFDLSGYDIVLSSSSGFAKGVITRANVPHISYIHTPTRYLWDSAHDAANNRGILSKKVLQGLQHYLRLLDYSAAQRPDVLLANSAYTQQRIQTFYRRQSTVVYPPIDTSFFTPMRTGEPKNYFLCVGRLTRSKRFEDAIEIFEKLQLPLVIVGTGADTTRLRHHAGTTTTFAGKVSREKLRDLMRGARALIQPGVEDFGMAAAEALACGLPVIAYGYGGVREIVRHGVHGLLYGEQRPEYLAESLRQFILMEHRFSPELLQKQALKFETSRFSDPIQQQISLALPDHSRNTNERYEV